MPELEVSNLESTPNVEAPASATPVVEPAVQPETTVVQGSSPTTGTVPEQVSTEDSTPFENVDPELAARPGFQNLRDSYNQLKAKVAEYEANAGSSPDSYLQITAPVDEMDFSEQLERMRTEVPPYYDAMAWAIMEKHLPQVLPIFLEKQDQLPPELRPMVEASATAILQSYTGLEPEQIGEAIRQYRQGQGVYQPNQFQPQTTISVNQPVDMNQLAYQYGLDATDPSHAALLQNLASQTRELNQLRSSVNELSQAEQTRVGQSSQGRVNEQIESFKTNLLSKVNVPTGYDYVKAEISDRVMSAFERDPVVKQARSNLEKFYKQGTPDLRAAASEVTKLQTQLAQHVKSIAEPRLKEIQDLETLKTLTSQAQAGIKNVPPGAGQATPLGAPERIGKTITPDNIGDLAWERAKAARLKPNPLS